MAFGASDKKRPGLAVLVGVGCCHEIGIGERLVNYLTIEAPLSALLLLCFELDDSCLKSLVFPLPPFQILLVATAAQDAVGRLVVDLHRFRCFRYCTESVTRINLSTSALIRVPH
jgi:hypothetical protein